MNKKTFSEYVKNFEFQQLFIDLGWDNYRAAIYSQVEQETFTIQGIAEKRGFVIVLCLPGEDGNIPLSKTRKKIEHNFCKAHQEHLIIYEDAAKIKQIWQYVVREPDKPRKTREIQYSKEQDPEILYQRARGLLFSLDEEENITLVDVVGRFNENFAQNTELVTKKFYTDFKKYHNVFLEFISGIGDAISAQENRNKQWYASLMLNRLMFCYFIQKRGYLDNNIHYLRDKLKEIKEKAGKNRFYSFYRDFLLILFHNGLGQPESQREHSVDLGRIPYLNGGLFDMHVLERQFEEINIKDEAFEKVFAFFDQWNWHLDTRVESSGKDINPDVIGYIFEKYINDRAAMGAYYTKEDITDYIGKNTIIPSLFDSVKKAYPKAFEKGGPLWTYLKQSEDTYIYDAVKKGVPDGNELFVDLPEEIRAGFMPEMEKELVKDLTSPHLWEIRKYWNRRAPEKIALPTETYREVIVRRKRYAQVLSKIERGEITEITDFITYNLNIRQFTQDFLEDTDDPDFVRHFFRALRSITILDPTCGSGAFLFAALNILEPLYETCIERMEQFTSEEPRKYKFFHEVLAEVNSEEHPNLGYYIYKTIILHNLYGVDIMHEAVEIAKLRLFLKMVGAVDINVHKPNLGLEPLPDVDFNIRAGNTLVGFATEEDFRNAVTAREPLYAEDIITEFEDEFTITSKAFKAFQDSQLITDRGEDTHKQAKVELQKRLDILNEKLNEYLATSYKIDKKKQKKKYEEWLKSHQPFHWFAEFYRIINGNGGFDVIIGNPPYVEYSQIQKHYQLINYMTTSCGNIYANTIERSESLIFKHGLIGIIVQLPIVCTDRMTPIQKFLKVQFGFRLFATFDDRPGKLFDGLQHIRATILIVQKSKKHSKTLTSTYNRWNTESRAVLFKKLAFIENEYEAVAGSIAKLGSGIHSIIFKKIQKLETITNYLSGQKKIYFHNAPQYWIRSTKKPPFFWNEKDGQKISVQIKALSFYEERSQNIGCSILNSSLFYIWFISLSDCRHLNMREIHSIPIFPYDSTDKKITSLNNMIDRLMSDYELHKFRKETNYKSTGRVIYDEYHPKYSKPIIDQIDTILAQHYGFTEEELDFIINYDIKYRMGKELDTYIEGRLDEAKNE